MNKIEKRVVNTPEKKFSAGAVSAAIWKNNGSSRKTGEAVEYRTITLQRSYKNKEGIWQTSNSLRVSDLPKATLVLDKAYEHIVLRNQNDDASSNEDEII